MVVFHLPVQQIADWVATPKFEARERFQRRVNRTFSTPDANSRTDWEQRYRYGFNFQNGPTVSGKLRGQYSHDLIRTEKKNFSDENSDLYIAEVDLKAKEGVFQIGRQILAKGSQRLFEDSQFGQRSKGFDLARYVGHGFDGFVGKVGYSSVKSDIARLAGLSYDWAAGETFVVYKYDQWVTHQNFWTFDHRWTKDWKSDSIDLEGAVQSGRIAGKDIDGWMLVSKYTHRFNKKWSAYLEADAFSGGSNATKQHRFEPLYGSVHGYYGLADVQGPQNVNDIEAGVVYKPFSNFQVLASYSSFQLRDARDGWFGANNDSINSRPGGKFIDPTGNSGRDVAQELDLQAKLQAGKYNYFTLEASYVITGHFIRNLVGKGATNQTWLGLWYELKY